MSGFRDRARSSAKTVTVEVRRKKMSLLDRKKALQSGRSEAKSEERKKVGHLPRGLTQEEFDSRVKALQSAQKAAQEPAPIGVPERAMGPVEVKSAPVVEPSERAQTAENPSDSQNEISQPAEAPTPSPSVRPVVYRAGGTSKSETTGRKPSQPVDETSVKEKRVDSSEPAPTASVTKSTLPERTFLGPQVRNLASANYSGEIRPRSSMLRSPLRGAESRTGRSIVRKEITLSPRSSTPSGAGPVILRAASYGPSAQQKEREAREAQERMASERMREGRRGDWDSRNDRDGRESRGGFEGRRFDRDGREGFRRDDRGGGGGPRRDDRPGERMGNRDGFGSAPSRRLGDRPMGTRGFSAGPGIDLSLFGEGKGEGKSSAPRPARKRPSGDFESGENGRRSRRGVSVTDGPRKLSRHVLTRVMDDEEDTRFRSEASYRRAQRKRLGSRPTEATKVVRDVIIPETISVGELSNRMAVSSAVVIKALMKLGTLASINQVLDADTAELICVEFGHRPKRSSDNDIEKNLRRGPDRPEDLLPRPPIITVMGHVDHGKTSLLDALRKTDIISTEFGGITQHIGAYQIVTPFSEAKITFLDTPGHAAFSAMRARGADVTDIVVLVVAADDSVNVQTIEAIAHAKAAGAPMIVAINKIDKPTADPQRIKSELLNQEVVLEDFGGDVMAVEISAKKGLNLDKLVEAILLQSEMLELRANPQGPAEGTIIEASVAKGRGTVATVLVRKGTLRPGDIFVAGTEFGRVKTMSDFRGQKVTEAEPSCPVEVLGFNGVPMAGDELIVVESEQVAREIAEHRRQVLREKAVLARTRNSVEAMMSQIATGETKTLNIVLKGDTQGSVEAIIANVEKLSVEGVKVAVIHSGVGDINESDMMLAKSSDGAQSAVFGFNVKSTPQAKMFADREGISIGYYTIVYELFEAIHKMMKGLTAPKFEERVLGRAELRVVFSKGKTTKIAGCYVQSGLIRRANSQVRVLRGNDVVFTGKIDTMKHEKDDIKEAKEGYECGIILDGSNDLKVGDIIECFEMAEVERD